MLLFRLFERLLEPTAPPEDTVPPSGLVAFYWYYARQARWLVGALFVAGFLVAILDTTIPVFIGRVVTLISNHAPGTLLREAGPQLLGMVAVLADPRPGGVLLRRWIANQAIAASLTNLIRWQSH
jgi:ATP-binding cassette subfamily B multidrug efflux pump